MHDYLVHLCSTLHEYATCSNSDSAGRRNTRCTCHLVVSTTWHDTRSAGAVGRLMAASWHHTARRSYRVWLGAPNSAPWTAAPGRATPAGWLAGCLAGWLAGHASACSSSSCSSTFSFALSILLSAHDAPLRVELSQQTCIAAAMPASLRHLALEHLTARRRMKKRMRRGCARISHSSARSAHIDSAGGGRHDGYLSEKVADGQ
jgi:hypothetical protein